TTEEHISVNPAPISGAVVRRAALLPFPGLASFDREDARFFFGRDADIAAVAQKLGETPDGRRRWLQIEGPSAVGKSSLAKAGVRRCPLEGAPRHRRAALPHHHLRQPAPPALPRAARALGHPQHGGGPP